LVLGNYIKVYESKLDKTICNDLIVHYKENGIWKDSTFSSNTKNTGSSSVSMREHWIRPGKKYHNALDKTFQECVHSYIKEYPRITPVAYTGFRLNHYGVNGFMRNHTDNIYKSHGQKLGYPHLTSLLFLNDTYEGGEFLMCDQQYKYKLSQGSVIVFPSNFMFDHEVAKVTKGDRYTCMTWIM